jgi:hypothetical protein
MEKFINACVAFLFFPIPAQADLPPRLPETVIKIAEGSTRFTRERFMFDIYLDSVDKTIWKVYRITEGRRLVVMITWQPEPWGEEISVWQIEDFEP